MNPKRMSEKQLREEANAWTARALASFVACQNLKVEAPPFPVSWNGLSLLIMTGRHQEIIAACQSFTRAAQPLLEAAQKG